MTTQQAAATQAEPAEAVGAGGSQAQQATAQNGMPQWIAEAIKDEAKQKDFVKAARATFDEDFKSHKEAAATRERQLLGQVSAAKAYQALSEEQRADLLDAQALRDEAIELASERGVPKDLLEDFPTAKSVRAFTKKYLAANGNVKPAAPRGDGDDMEARIAAKVREILGGKPNPVDMNQPGNTGGGVVADQKTMLRRRIADPNASPEDRMAAIQQRY